MSMGVIKTVLKTAIVALAALAATALLILHQCTDVSEALSDKIARPDPQLDGLIVLIPNLSDARVFTADRPSHRSERKNSNRLDKIKRRREFRVDTNSLGLRGPELSEGSALRVLTLGDSVTFGWGVSYEESWPVQLGSQLSIHVINAGMPAFTSAHMAQWAVARGASFDPEVILFSRRPGPDDRTEDGEFLTAIHAIEAAMPKARIGIVLPPLSTFAPKGQHHVPEDAAWVRSMLPDHPLLDLQEVFEELQSGSGVEMVWQGDAWSLVDRADKGVLLQGRGDPAELPLEISAFFEDNAHIREPLFIDDGHPDAEGHGHIAAAVASWLVSSGLGP